MKHTRIEDLSQEEKNRLLERMLREGRFPGARSGPTARRAPTPPRTELEKDLAVWATPYLGAGSDNVYAPLPPNLITPDLAEELSARVGVALSARELKAIPTLAALAALVETRRSVRPAPPPLMPCEPPGQPAPNQLRFWFFHHLEGPAAAFNLATLLTMEGLPDTRRLHRAAMDLYGAHHILRSRFTERDGRPIQQVLPLPKGATHLVDVSGLPDPRAAADHVVTRNMRAPFDPAVGRLSRLVMVRLSPTTHHLSLTQHRMVADTRAGTLFLSRLGARYKAYLDTENPPALPRGHQFADFAHLQWREADGAWQGQSDYWAARLKDIPQRHRLPTDRPRPGIQRFQGGHEKLRVNLRLAHGLTDLGAAEGADLYTVLLTAFAVFLSRYSRDTDILTGVFHNHREDHPALAEVLGPCDNPLVMRTHVHDRHSFMAHLHAVRCALAEARAHGDLPFERVVDALSPRRSLAHAPLFQIAFRLDKRPTPPRFPALRTGLTLGNPFTCLYDLMLHLEVDKQKLAGRLIYNEDLFDAETAARMCRHFKTLLAALPVAAYGPVAALPLLSAEERETMLVDWNTTAINLGPRLCIHDLVQRQVTHTPDAPALLWTEGDLSLTYAEVNAAANRLAHTLIAHGVGPEQTVALCTRRAPAAVIGMLAVLKAGAAYVPLDPDFPAERIGFILGDAGVRTALVAQEAVDLFGTLQGALITMDALGRCATGSGAVDNPVGTVRDYHRATLFYTSGSEGYPKGVITAHRSLVNRLRWAQEVFPLSAKDRFLQLATLHFDVALWEMTAPLISGALLVVPPGDVSTDIGRLVRLTAQYQISAMHFIPSLLHAFLQDTRVFHAKHLRLVFCGGDALAMSTVLQFFEKLPARLVHFYGPTEAAINVTTASCRTDWQMVTIGRPIANNAVYVLDKNLNPVPPMVQGELYLSGVALARGYEGRPVRTALSFVPNPFSGEHPFAAGGSRLYKTGDLAALAPNGTIYFQGRCDRQVKVSGFRIEPSEIEHLLIEMPGVADCVVVSHPISEEMNRLIAYLQPMEGATLKAADLRAQLARALPDFMIPGAFVMLEKMPYLAAGKIDRSALPGPEAEWFARGGNYVAPRTREEHILANIWAEILGLEQVGIYDNFFKLGGDSMLIVRMQARAAEAGLTLTTRRLFEHPNIAQLVGTLAESEAPLLPHRMVMHAVFEQVAAERGEARALLEESGASWSYAALNHGANQMAARLLRFGLGRGRRIGVCCRGAKALIGTLGVLKAGAACLSINPSWPEEHRRWCCESAGLDAVVLDDAVLLPHARIPLFLVNVDSTPTPDPATDVQHNDAALITYRRQRTGKDRLVVVDHACLVHPLAALTMVPGFTRDDVFVLLEPREPQWMLLPLTVGGCLVLPNRDTHLDPVQTHRLLEATGATTALVGNAGLPSFLKALRPGHGGLKLLLEGDIAVPEARLLLGRYRQMWHLFGWPETGYCCARGLLEARTLKESQSHVALNGPIHGAWLYVLDEQLYSARPGTLGALYVGGTAPAQSYLEDPAATADRFIPDPFSREPGARLYRTGRRAYYLTDGRIFFP